MVRHHTNRGILEKASNKYKTAITKAILTGIKTRFRLRFCLLLVRACGVSVTPLRLRRRATARWNANASLCCSVLCLFIGIVRPFRPGGVKPQMIFSLLSGIFAVRQPHQIFDITGPTRYNPTLHCVVLCGCNGAAGFNSFLPMK